MLALRAATRSRFVNVIPSSARWYRPTPRILYQPLLEPYTWRARLWCRRDGTPRSKRKGAVYATTAFIFYVLVSSLQDAVDEIYYLTVLARIQRVDGNFSSYDFSRRADVLTYFMEIAKCLPVDGQGKEKDFEMFRQALERLMELSPEFSGLLRGEMENLHALLTQDLTQDPLVTAEAVIEALTGIQARVFDKLQTDDIPEEVEEQKLGREDTYEVVG